MSDDNAMVSMVAVETHHYYVWFGNSPSHGGYYMSYEEFYVGLTTEAARMIKGQWWSSGDVVGTIRDGGELVNVPIRWFWSALIYGKRRRPVERGNTKEATRLHLVFKPPFHEKPTELTFLKKAARRTHTNLWQEVGLD